MDNRTREILKDRMRHEIKHDAEFTDFLKTIKWEKEDWVGEYENRQDDLFSDLIDLWYEVEEEKC